MFLAIYILNFAKLRKVVFVDFDFFDPLFALHLLSHISKNDPENRVQKGGKII